MSHCISNIHAHAGVNHSRVSCFSAATSKYFQSRLDHSIGRLTSRITERHHQIGRIGSIERVSGLASRGNAGDPVLQRRQALFEIGEEDFSVHRGVDDERRPMPSCRRPATKVVIFQWPCGTLATSRWPRGQRSRSLVMLVEVPVSSMKTISCGVNIKAT